MAVNEEKAGCEYGQETHDMAIKIQERLKAVEEEIARRYRDGCRRGNEHYSKMVSFEERMKNGDETFARLIVKVDYLTQEIVTLGVKFGEAEKRAERNSRILWGLVTAVIVQLIAFGLTFLR